MTFNTSDSNPNNESNQNDQSIGDFAAIKTSIANGDIDEVKARLDGKSLKSLEKDYLVDLAKLSGNSDIVDTLEAMPEAK
ncbi:MULTISPECIES: hypothetical protein [unclassified Alteromonas]|uniref:hypothetical protein n=1 Tax=unclassified Alteromonas TaxID=2614992 RepID=UPI000B6ED326|nr:hypothetical protein [Alteromonas sp.]MAI36905.1 hypothetical protein [Alteromonas sp.]OUX90213.1 MAG: hypothetical protein CBB95_04945 [Alteromonas sp. TMED35]|tara:strand:+ start:3451 stop:3690 length:240 start_codon:yes stop_codon:yes gene_type:complete